MRGSSSKEGADLASAVGIEGGRPRPTGPPASGGEGGGGGEGKDSPQGAAGAGAESPGGQPPSESGDERCCAPGGGKPPMNARSSSLAVSCAATGCEAMQAQDRPSAAVACLPGAAPGASDMQRLVPRPRGGGKLGRGRSSARSGLGLGLTSSAGGSSPGGGLCRATVNPRVPSGPFAYRIPRSTMTSPPRAAAEERPGQEGGCAAARRAAADEAGRRREMPFSCRKKKTRPDKHRGVWGVQYNIYIANNGRTFGA